MSGIYDRGVTVLYFDRSNSLAINSYQLDLDKGTVFFSQVAHRLILPFKNLASMVVALRAFSMASLHPAPSPPHFVYADARWQKKLCLL